MNSDLEILLVWAIIWTITGGIVTPFIYRRKRRSPWTGVFAGAFCGFLGGIILLVPLWLFTPHLKKPCPHCAELVHVDSSVCKHCGHEFTTDSGLSSDPWYNDQMNVPLTPAENITSQRPVSPLTPPQPAPAAAPVPVPQQRPRVDAWLIDNNNNFFQLFQGQNRIGRSADNDLVLNESSISRHHAVIYEQNGSFIIQNRSTNQDVLVNGVPLNSEHRTLEKNASIGLGEMTFTFILR